MSEIAKTTGYPSIDRPWLKYYTQKAVDTPLPEMTMFQYLFRNNEKHLFDAALWYFGTTITFDKLFKNIEKAACAFRSIGIRPGDIVTIMSMHTPETIYAIYGLNYIGAVANMVYMTLRENEILETLANTESKLFLVLDAALDRVEAIKDKLNIPVVVLKVAESMPLPMRVGYSLKQKPSRTNFISWASFINTDGHNALIQKDSKSAAIIVYTSGSTGTPKGVILNNTALNSYAFQVRNEVMKTVRGDSFLMILPPFVGFGIATLHEILCNGFKSLLLIDLKPEVIVNTFFKVKPNYFVGGPALIETFLSHTPTKHSDLKLFIGGGGALAVDKEKEINQYLSQCGSDCVYAGGYGLTEGGSTLCSSTNEIYKLGSSGIPLINTNVKVVDTETGEMLPFGEIGELHFSTPDLMVGYYKNENATDEILYTDHDGNKWVRTGDLGYVDTDGFVFIKGRLKRIYITRGQDGTVYKLFPQRIEEFFYSLEIVAQCGVVVKEIESSIYVPIVFITIKDAGQENDIQLFYSAAKKGLPDHMQPNRIVLIDTMPMTQSGKIDYRALERMI